MNQTSQMTFIEWKQTLHFCLSEFANPKHFNQLFAKSFIISVEKKNPLILRVRKRRVRQVILFTFTLEKLYQFIRNNTNSHGVVGIYSETK